ncbi:MAG: hypothetical protein LBQ50_01760 [Planctomycetaceae bacterium]|nr:hypothetical protein [Planctomycetaceae bacterium]
MFCNCRGKACPCPCVDFETESAVLGDEGKSRPYKDCGTVSALMVLSAVADAIYQMSRREAVYLASWKLQKRKSFLFYFCM